MRPTLGLILTFAWAMLVTAVEPSSHHFFEIRRVLDQPTPDSERLTLLAKDSEGKSVPVVLHVAKRALLDETDLKAASIQSDPLTGTPQVGLTFTPRGRTAFADVTRTNLNNQLAILIDGKVVSAPVIRTEIRDGKAVIDGRFTQEEAETLANRINKIVQAGSTEKMKP